MSQNEINRENTRQENERANRITVIVFWVIIPAIVSALGGAGCM